MKKTPAKPAVARPATFKQTMNKLGKLMGDNAPMRLGDIKPINVEFMSTGIEELDQVLGADLDVGADVEEEHLLAGDRQLHRQGGALHALEPAHAEGRRRHRRPGRAGADHRRRAPFGDVAGGAHHRGLLLRPHRPRRVLVVADPLSGLDHLDPVGVTKAERRLGPVDAHADAVLTDGLIDLFHHAAAP